MSLFDPQPSVSNPLLVRENWQLVGVVLAVLTAIFAILARLLAPFFVGMVKRMLAPELAALAASTEASKLITQSVQSISVRVDSMERRIDDFDKELERRRRSRA